MALLTPRGRVILVRHGAVALEWKKRCYGKQDVPLCDQWMLGSEALVEKLSSVNAVKLFHSGLVRSRWLAQKVATRSWNPAAIGYVIDDRRLRERDFGKWEGETWDDVFASDPERFHDLIHKPDSYRPPGGETTREMQSRVVSWFLDCKLDEGTVIAISHSGPIAALAGHLLDLPPDQWTPWMIGYGESITIQERSEVDRSIQVTRGFREGDEYGAGLTSAKENC